MDGGLQEGFNVYCACKTSTNAAVYATENLVSPPDTCGAVTPSNKQSETREHVTQEHCTSSSEEFRETTHITCSSCHPHDGRVVRTFPTNTSTRDQLCALPTSRPKNREQQYNHLRDKLLLTTPPTPELKSPHIGPSSRLAWRLSIGQVAENGSSANETIPPQLTCSSAPFRRSPASPLLLSRRSLCAENTLSSSCMDRIIAALAARAALRSAVRWLCRCGWSSWSTRWVQ